MGGRWLVMEGLDCAAPEVLAALAPLLEARCLHLPHRAQTLPAAPGFQFLATATAPPGASRPFTALKAFQLGFRGCQLSRSRLTPSSHVVQINFTDMIFATAAMPPTMNALAAFSRLRVLLCIVERCGLGATSSAAGQQHSTAELNGWRRGAAAGVSTMPHGIRDMLGSLLSVVHLEAPPPLEQLAILEASFPDLQPLLPTALAMLGALLPEPHTRFLPLAPLLPVCSLIV